MHFSGVACENMAHAEMQRNALALARAIWHAALPSDAAFRLRLTFSLHRAILPVLCARLAFHLHRTCGVWLAVAVVTFDSISPAPTFPAPRDSAMFYLTSLLAFTRHAASNHGTHIARCVLQRAFLPLDLSDCRFRHVSSYR